MAFEYADRGYVFEIGKIAFKDKAKNLLEKWRKEYNEVRPHSSLDYRPPAPVTYNNRGSLTLKVVQ